MNASGQLQFEAACCFAALLAILGILLAALSSASDGLDLLWAKAQAESCCIAVDSLYAGSVLHLLHEMPCTAKHNRVESLVNQAVKASQCIAPEARSVRKEAKNVLEVELNEHYR